MKELIKKLNLLFKVAVIIILGKEETVTAPRRWLSDPDHVVAELAYITPSERDMYY
jgi:hypothetical protein